MSEVKHPCVFGLGECSIMPRLLEDAKQIHVLLAVKKEAEVAPQYKMFMEYWDGIVKQYVTAIMASSRGAFCQACIELKKLRGELK